MSQRRSSSSARKRKKSSSSRLRSFFDVIFSRLIVVPLLILGLIAAGVVYYYYQEYSVMLDSALSGDVFMRSQGIYAAPKQLRVGSSMKPADLIAQLKHNGYLERGSTKNEKRSVFAARGNVVDIFPGDDAIINGIKNFRTLKVGFGANGIQSINDTETGESLQSAEIEPELISSLQNPEREKRKNIEYRDVPQILVDAITTIEDRYFFEHYGVDWRGILRAFIRNTEEGRITGGGSSITQQLVKNLFLTTEQTYTRKLKEAFISIILEQRLNKEQIFAMYCNEAYLGQRAGFQIKGFSEAARAYFDKDISQINVAEAAMLAGIIRSPNHLYAPTKYPDRTRERRDFVLNELANQGKISETEAQRAKQLPLGIKGNGTGRLDISEAPYFIDYLTKQVEKHLDNGNGSARALRIYSTIDLDLQRAAYQAVSKNIHALERGFAKRKGGVAGLQAALVAMNPKTGEVVAMVGGKDYATSQFNRATDAKRQPGSVFKPFVYTAAINTAEYGGDTFTPATLFMDSAKTFRYGFNEEYKPNNFGDTFSNKNITLRDALVNSKNVITVELAERVGFNEIARLAEKAGLPKPPTYPSMALGVAEATPLQMASAYTMFANKGKRTAPTVFRRITDAKGTALDMPAKETKQVVSSQVAYIMTSMMKDVLNRGTGTRVRQMGFRAPAAGKTGSSRDGWFVGYTPNLVCAVYVGFDDSSDLGMTGGNTAAPIWADFMSRALAIRPELGGEFEVPDGIIQTMIDPTTGQTAKNNSGRIELFINGTEPTGAIPVEGSPEDDQYEPAPDSKEIVTETEKSKAPAPQKVTSILSDQPARQNLNDSNYLTFEVCAVTGLLPSEFCSNTAMRRYKIGREPTNFCPKSVRH